MFLGENADEFLEVSDTSTSQKLGQLFVAVTWLYNVDKMLSLRPRDTSGISKLGDKRNVRGNTIQHFASIDRQQTRSNFV